MKNLKSDPTKTALTIAVGFSIIFLVFDQKWALMVSIGVGLIGIFSPFLTRKIDFLWMKLTWLLSLIVPNIVLSLIFYVFLFPIALFSRLFRSKDQLILKRPDGSTFQDVNRSYSKESFEKPW